MGEKKIQTVPCKVHTYIEYAMFSKMVGTRQRLKTLEAGKKR